MARVTGSVSGSIRSGNRLCSPPAPKGPFQGPGAYRLVELLPLETPTIRLVSFHKYIQYDRMPCAVTVSGWTLRKP